MAPVQQTLTSKTLRGLSSITDKLSADKEDKFKKEFDNKLAKLKSRISDYNKELRYSNKFSELIYNCISLIEKIDINNFNNISIMQKVENEIKRIENLGNSFYKGNKNIIRIKRQRVKDRLRPPSSLSILETEKFNKYQSILKYSDMDPTGPDEMLYQDYNRFKSAITLIRQTLVELINEGKKYSEALKPSNIKDSAKYLGAGLAGSVLGPAAVGLAAGTFSLAKNANKNWQHFRQKTTAEKMKVLGGGLLTGLSVISGSPIGMLLGSKIKEDAEISHQRRIEETKNRRKTLVSFKHSKKESKKIDFLEPKISNIKAAGGLPTSIFNKKTKLTFGEKSDNPEKLNLFKNGKKSTKIANKSTDVILNKGDMASVIPLGKPGITTVNNVKAAGGINAVGAETSGDLSKTISKATSTEPKKDTGLIASITISNGLLKELLNIAKEQHALATDVFEFQQEQANLIELSQKDKAKVAGTGGDKKEDKSVIEKAKEKTSEIAKAIKSTIMTGVTSLLPKDGKGWGKLGGGIVGAGAGAYGGAKAGGWLAKQAEEHGLVEEGGTGSKIIKGATTAVGGIGGALLGSKIGESIASKIPGISGLLGGAGKMATTAMAKSDADQKVYVTNAAEIGDAVKGSGSPTDDITDKVTDAITEKATGKLSGLFSKMAGKPGIMGKIGGIGGKLTGLLGGGAGAAGAVTEATGAVGGVASKGVGLLGKMGPMLGGLAKFAGPIGLAMTAGQALHSGYKGWKNAGEIAGVKPGEKATTGQKAGSAAAGALSSLTLGLVSSKSIYGVLTGGLSNLFNKQNKFDDELQKQKEDSNKEFFTKIGAEGSTPLLGGLFSKVKEGFKGAKEAYTATREKGGGVFESIKAGVGGAKKGLTGTTKERETQISKAADAAGITDPKEKASFMGNMAHESAGFTSLNEGKYSAKKVWEMRGKTLSKKGVTLEQMQASEAKGGKGAMYEYMYSDKYRDKGSKMGNDQEGDAEKFKGRGFVQLTGKNNYKDMSSRLQKVGTNVDLVKNPELAEDPKIAAQIATIFWKKSGAGAKARAGDLVGANRAINGGDIGKEDRLRRTAQYEQEGSIQDRTKNAAAGAETTKLKNTELTQNAEGSKQKSPQVINNVVNNSGGAGGQKMPAPVITTADRNSYPMQLARTY
jgi:predicted chitinase